MAKRAVGVAAAPKKAFGRSLADFGKLSKAEEELIEACRRGVFCVLGDGKRPDKATAENTIRASLIRFLALGGDDDAPVHEKGIWLEGAFIKDELDLEACMCEAPLWLHGCLFEEAVTIRDASMPMLSLRGSSVPGITGDRVTASGGIFLRHGFRATGEVRLLGAEIGSNLDCSGGEFLPKEGPALSCDRATFKGGVFFTEGFRASGEVRLLGVKVGGNLSCESGEFAPTKGDALTCDGAMINGALVFRNVAIVTGPISFAGCRASALIDDLASWMLVPGLVLDASTYDRIGDGPTDAASRIAWLRRPLPKNLLNQDFQPQPWEQCIKVLREMGHDRAARKIAIAKQEELRRAGEFKELAWLLHWLYGALAGYGYKPLQTVLVMVAAWFIFGVIYQGAGDFGLMGPSSPIIHADERLQSICGMESWTRETQWTQCAALAQEYTTFSPYLYSLDLVLPLVDLQQDKDWGPIVMRDDSQTFIWSGVFIRFVMWFEILFGWAMSLLLVAVLGNLVKKD